MFQMRGLLCRLGASFTQGANSFYGNTGRKTPQLPTPNGGNINILGSICGYNVVMTCLLSGCLGLENVAVVVSNAPGPGDIAHFAIAGTSQR